jgi:hypothetical protein
MSYRSVLAAGDISSSPVLARRFRGKAAKETYRCLKGVILTRSFTKPLGFAALQVPRELSKGVVYTAIGQVGESVLGYISGVGFVRYLYKVVEPEKFKATCRLAYNIGCLPLTLYSKGVGSTFDFLRISELEKMWFGEPVYIFDDNRLWIETNFTLGDIFKQID